MCVCVSHDKRLCAVNTESDGFLFYQNRYANLGHAQIRVARIRRNDRLRSTMTHLIRFRLNEFYIEKKNDRAHDDAYFCS